MSSKDHYESFWIGAVLKQPTVSIVRSSHGEAANIGAFGALSFLGTAMILIKIPDGWLADFKANQQALVAIFAVIILALIYSETLKPLIRVDELTRIQRIPSRYF